MAAKKHLWEVEHDYYCAEGCYYSSEPHNEFPSWEAFLDEEGDADLDMNLLFRWDWDRTEKTLKLYFMGQRKALPRSVFIRAMHADEEPSVRAWLAKRWTHLRNLWAPVGDPVPTRIVRKRKGGE